MDASAILAIGVMGIILGLSLYFGFVVKAKHPDERKLRMRLACFIWIVVIVALALTNFVPKEYHLFLIIAAVLIINVLTKRLKKG